MISLAVVALASSDYVFQLTEHFYRQERYQLSASVHNNTCSDETRQSAPHTGRSQGLYVKDGPPESTSTFLFFFTRKHRHKRRILGFLDTTFMIRRWLLFGDITVDFYLSSPTLLNEAKEMLNATLGGSGIHVNIKQDSPHSTEEYPYVYEQLCI